MSKLALARAGGDVLPRTTKVELMAGAALFLAANQYPRVLQVVVEAVQNGIDANATVIEVMIDRKKRHIVIRDNGEGVSYDSFNGALRSVCQSSKSRDKLGQFGIGLVAALGKCKEFTFTTLASKNSAFCWTFECDAIRKLKDVEIPVARVPVDALWPKKNRAFGVTRWTSELSIMRYSKDSQIGRLVVDELRQEIVGNFGAVMRERNVLVWVSETTEDGTVREPVAIRASEFTGKALPEHKASNKVGVTQIRLFVVPRHSKRKGEMQVGVSDNAFRLRFKDFAKQVSTNSFLNQPVADAMLSGVFEGEMLHSRITLDANRKTFAEDDALLDFCIQIENWFVEFGQEHVKRAQDERVGERLQELGKRSLEHLKELFKGNEDILAVLRNAKIGRVGAGHAERPPQKIVGQDEIPTVRVGTSVGASPSPGDHKHPNEVPPSDVPADMPYTVGGPSGRRRSLVKDDSQGLTFCHVDMDSPDLWRFDAATGTLNFNITHPDWVECDKNDTDILRLQEFIAVHALMAETMPEAERAFLRPFLQRLGSPTVSLLKNSPSFVIGKRRRESEKNT